MLFDHIIGLGLGYDLVSLLKDCYIAWPRARVVGWVSGYRELLRSQGGPAGASEAQFLRWFDLIGVQRHLKVLGIFCRLWYRDGKPGYLAHIPRIEGYLARNLAHPALAALRDWHVRHLPGLLDPMDPPSQPT